MSKTRPKPRPEEPPQAVRGSRPRCFRNWLLKPPARASEPWCLRRRTCKAGAFSGGLRQAAVLLGVTDCVGLGVKPGLVGKGPGFPRYAIQSPYFGHHMGTMWGFKAPPARRLGALNPLPGAVQQPSGAEAGPRKSGLNSGKVIPLCRSWGEREYTWCSSPCYLRRLQMHKHEGVGTFQSPPVDPSNFNPNSL